MLDLVQMRSMCSEIKKKAGVAGQLGRAFIHSPFRSAVAGGVGGAALGAGREALRKTAPGERKNYLRSAGIGAVGGAALAGGAAGAGRAVKDTALLQAAKGMKPTLGGAVSGTFRRAGKGVQEATKRQIHGFTGMYEGSMGSAPFERKAKLFNLRAQEQLKHLPAVPKGRGTTKAIETVAKNQTKRKAIEQALLQKTKHLAEQGNLHQKALKAGITSVPGIAKGLVIKPIETGKAMLSHAAGGGGKGALAMGVGLPAAMAAPDLAKGDESATGGRTMKQKVMGHGTDLAVGVATGGLPMLPSMVAGSLAAKGAKRLSGEHALKKKFTRKGVDQAYWDRQAGTR